MSFDEVIKIQAAEPVYGAQVGLMNIRVHSKEDCKGPNCCIHNPSDHPLKDAPLNWRAARRLMERLCEHGVGHPDWDDLAFKRLTRGNDYAWGESVHGCCEAGCCAGDLVIDGLPARWFVDGYAASSNGKIWSYWRCQGAKRGNERLVDLDHHPKELQPRPNDGGYLRVQISGRDEYIHRLMWTVWKGEIPEGLQVRHWDGDQTHNSISNLRVGTQVENEEDKERHGHRQRGEVHVNSKMTSGQVIEARQLAKQGLTLNEIISTLNLSIHRASLQEAVSGETWRQLNEAEAPHRYRPRRDDVSL